MDHIYEHAGVMLHVNYTRAHDGVPEFNAIHVMDSNYRPIGPNLKDLLDDAYKIDVSRAEAETFLSAITGELPQ